MLYIDLIRRKKRGKGCQVRPNDFPLTDLSYGQRQMPSKASSIVRFNAFHKTPLLPHKNLFQIEMASKPLSRLSRCIIQPLKASKRPQCRFLTTSTCVRSDVLQVVRPSFAICRPYNPHTKVLFSTEIPHRTTRKSPSSSMPSTKNSSPKSSSATPRNTRKRP